MGHKDVIIVGFLARDIFLCSDTIFLDHDLDHLMRLSHLPSEKIFLLPNKNLFSVDGVRQDSNYIQVCFSPCKKPIVQPLNE